MRMEDVIRIKEILDESLTWEPDVLEKMPRLFLLIRETYIRALYDESGTNPLRA